MTAGLTELEVAIIALLRHVAQGKEGLTEQKCGQGKLVVYFWPMKDKGVIEMYLVGCDLTKLGIPACASPRAQVRP